jgi:predicted RNA-binding Zn-ribbon protein involved in translation (DUF1610 family)
LCFADLRPPAPVREPVTVPAAAAADVSALLAGTPLAPDVPVAGLPTPTAASAAAVTSGALAAGGKAAVWPCPRCGAQVPISLDSCTDCGAGFLAGATATVGTRLPLVGDVNRMSQGQRLIIGAGVSIILMAIFVLILSVGGQFF